MDLSTAEIRVLGCLLEKQRTTPDHYPLSLNSLRLACNQSTNRDPVVDYDEAVIRDALHRLERRGFTRLAGASRAAKYRHLLSQALPMSDAEQAIVCVLMLRGPQTPGELKQRGERIHAFVDLEEVHATLADLIGRDLVARLERRPGQKEERYSQLLGEDTEIESSVSSFTPTRHSEESVGTTPSTAHAPELSERVARLEREVGELRATLAQLLERTGLERERTGLEHTGGSEGAGSEGAGSESAGSESAGSEGAGSEGAGLEGADLGDAGLEGAGSASAGSEGAAIGGDPAFERVEGVPPFERAGEDPAFERVEGGPAFERAGGDPAFERDSREAEGGQPQWSEEVAQHNP